jgi:hypothetical protein
MKKIITAIAIMVFSLHAALSALQQNIKPVYQEINWDIDKSQIASEVCGDKIRVISLINSAYVYIFDRHSKKLLTSFFAGGAQNVEQSAPIYLTLSPDGKKLLSSQIGGYNPIVTTLTDISTNTRIGFWKFMPPIFFESKDGKIGPMNCAEDEELRDFGFQSLLNKEDNIMMFEKKWNQKKIGYLELADTQFIFENGIFTPNIKNNNSQKKYKISDLDILSKSNSILYDLKRYFLESNKCEIRSKDIADSYYKETKKLPNLPPDYNLLTSIILDEPDALICLNYLSMMEPFSLKMDLENMTIKRGKWQGPSFARSFRPLYIGEHPFKPPAVPKFPGSIEIEKVDLNQNRPVEHWLVNLNTISKSILFPIRGESTSGELTLESLNDKESVMPLMPEDWNKTNVNRGYGCYGNSFYFYQNLGLGVAFWHSPKRVIQYLDGGIYNFKSSKWINGIKSHHVSSDNLELNGRLEGPFHFVDSNK